MKKTAFITGASVGIGKEFARQLSETHNLVIIARNQSALEELQTTLESKNPGIQIDVIVSDLTIENDIVKLEERIREHPSIDLLVNNAGFGTIGDFSESDIKKELNEIQLNVTTLVRLTHSALNRMKELGGGSIINVASIAGYLPAPYSATYSATKAFVRSFSESIHEEALNYGVVVQALCPGLTHSDFHQRAGIDKTKLPDFMWSSADKVVEDSLEELKEKSAVCIPGGFNQTAVGISQLLPSSITRKFAGIIMKK